MRGLRGSIDRCEPITTLSRALSTLRQCVFRRPTSTGDAVIFVRCGDAHALDVWPASDVIVTDPPFGVSKRYAGVIERRSYVDHVARILAIAEMTGARTAIIRGPSVSLGDPQLPRPTRVLAECRTVVLSRAGHASGSVYAWTPWYVFGALPRTALHDWWSIGPAHNGLQDAVRIELPGDDHPGLTPAASSAAVLARGTLDDDRILDPFAGAGGIGVESLRHGRAYAGTEIVPEYAAEAQRRCALMAGAQTSPLLVPRPSTRPLALWPDGSF